MLRKLFLSVLIIGVLFAISWSLFFSKGHVVPKDIVINRESSYYDRVSELEDDNNYGKVQIDESLLEENSVDASVEVLTEEIVEPSNEDRDLEYTVLDSNTAPFAVLYAVTNSLEGNDEFSQFFDSSFFDTYFDLLSTDACQALNGVVDFDSFRCDYDFRLMYISSQGVEYTFEFNINDSGLIDSIEFIG